MNITNPKGSFVDHTEVPGDTWTAARWDARSTGLADIRFPDGRQYCICVSRRPFPGPDGDYRHRYWVWGSYRRNKLGTFKTFAEAMAYVADLY